MTIASKLAGIVAAGLLLAGPAQADGTAAPGPYYATPSWDQQLPPATRWVILTNWNSQAVLDRETGLVWQTNLLATPVNYEAALNTCRDSFVGGRGGWRLPTLEEVARTLYGSPGSPFVLVSAHEIIAGTPFPFAGPNASARTIWTSTPTGDGTRRAAFIVADGLIGAYSEAPTAVSDGFSAWCVQSP